MVSAELVPLAKAGGLGDVVGSLARALVRLGHDVRCALPRHGVVADRLAGTAESARTEVRLDIRGRFETAVLSRVEGGGLPAPVVLVIHPLFDRPGIYDDPATRQGYPDNGLRWAVFCRAVHAGLGLDGWIPDVVHAHDHQAALVLGLLKWIPMPPGLTRRPAMAYTIHNLGYQGSMQPVWMADSGLPWTLLYSMGPIEFNGRANLMKMGIEAADRVTTVSPTYAREIQTPEFGAGLEAVLRASARKLFGIRNGIDTETWDPSLDPLIPSRYTRDNPAGKTKDRAFLREEAGLPPASSAKMPLLGMVGRLTSQKGLDLLLPVLDTILSDGMQMVVLGTGEARYESALAEASRRTGSLAVRIGFDEQMAHRIEAGADVFLMPSRYEPCGLNQMYSLRYGTVPVVRAVGGLADTVTDLDEDPETANGFVFRAAEPPELLKTVRRAARAFGNKPVWRRLMARGMQGDFSWETSARAYGDVYRDAVRAAHG